MRWVVTQNGNLQASRLPWKTFRLPVSVRIENDDEVELCSVEYWAAIGGPTHSWPTVSQSAGPQRLSSRGGTAYVSLGFPFDDEFIRAIEDWRQGGAGPVKFEVYLNLVYRAIEQVPLPRELEGAVMKPRSDVVRPESQRFVEQLGRPETEQVRLPVELNRDAWIAMLRSMGWDEFHLFEVPVRVLKRNETLARGLRHLDEAQAAFRQGQWDMAITETRRAVEAAARTVQPEGDMKSATSTLLLAVFPDDHDEAKRKAVSGTMMALADLRNQTAHGHNLRIQVRREDAEFALTVAISLFRYLGEALSRQERKNEG